MAKFESEESVFNFAVEYLKDISHSLKMCGMYSSYEDIDNWLRWLRITYRQLSVKLTPEEEKGILGDYEKKIDFKELTDDIIKDEEANFKNIYFLTHQRERIKHKKVILFLLDKLEVKLRKKLQEKGMLLPSKADPRFAILER